MSAFNVCLSNIFLRQRVSRLPTGVEETPGKAFVNWFRSRFTPDSCLLKCEGIAMLT